MGDKYEAGQAGAMGPGAHAHDMTFQQIWQQSSSEIDLPTLATQLSQLRAAMSEERESAEHDISIGQVAAAEQAASKGDGPKALEYLKNAGKWALDIASKIGVELATATLKTAFGSGT